MAYTAAELTTFFANANLGAAPSAAQALLLSSYAAQTQSGAITDAAAVQKIVDMMDGTTSVAVQAYQFFTGSTPSVAGLTYLVNSADNKNDLNDAAGQYAPLNTENRYINFSINLGTGAGAGAASFAATYGTLSFADVVSVAYETVIGSAAAKAAGLDPAASIAYFSRAENQTYLRAFVAARAPSANVELAIRAAVVGQIMSAGATANVGNYNAAATNLIVGGTDGTFDNGLTATAGVNLLTAFSTKVAPTPILLTVGVDNLTGTGAADAFLATPQVSPDTGTSINTLGPLDSLDGGAGADTLTIQSILNMGGGIVIPAGAAITNIETINVATNENAVIDLLALSRVTGVTNLNVTNSTGNDSVTSVAGVNVSVVDQAGTVTINGVSASQTVTTAGGVALSGSTGAIKVTDTAQAAVNSSIDGGTTVDLTTTTNSTGKVDIGFTAKPTGTINVTENLKGSGNVTGGAITISGGTVDTLKVIATQALIPAVGLVNVQGVTGVTETSSAQFSALTVGQTLTAGGLTFTAGALGTTAIETAEAFESLKAGATGGSSLLGTYSGTFAGWNSGAGGGTTSVLFTSTPAASTTVGNVADLVFTGTGTLPVHTVTQGVKAVQESGSATFNALAAGQTLTAGGLTFTAGAAGTTAAQTAAAFGGISAGAAGTSTLGTYTGTLTGWNSAAATTGNVVKFTSTTATGDVTDLAFTGTGTTLGTTTVGALTVNGATTSTTVNVIQTPNLAAVVAVDAVAGVTETNSAVFSALTFNQTLTVGGLTFTAGALGTTAAQTAAAFANLAKGATQGNSTLGTYSGTLTGWTSGAVSGNTVLFSSEANGVSLNGVTTLQSNVTDLALAISGSLGVTLPTLTKTDGVALASAITGVGGVTNGNVAVTSTGNVLTTANIDGFSGAGNTVQSDALTSLSLANSQSASTITIANTKATTLGLTTNGLSAKTINGVIDTATTITGLNTYTALNVTTGATKSVVKITADAVQDLTVSGASAINMSSASTALSSFAALKTVTVSGAAGLTLDAKASSSLTSVNASASTGANTITIDGTTATFTGGVGSDTLIFAPGKAATLIGSSDGGAGAGIDTLGLSVGDATTVSASTTFATKVTGFEILSLNNTLNNVSTSTIDLAQLGGYTNVTTGAAGIADDNTTYPAGSVAGTMNLNKLASGGTLTLTAKQVTAGSTYNVSVTDATVLTNTNDVLNLVVTNKAGSNFGTVVAAGVETVNITANNTMTATTINGVVTTPIAPQTHSLTLQAVNATTVTLKGSANLANITLTNTGNIALTKIDGSAMTGVLTVTAAGTVAETILGGSGNDVLTASTGVVGDTLIGGAGNDKLTSNAGLTTLTGGAGADTFVVATAGTNLNTYTTITDAQAGDIIQLAPKGTEVFNTIKLALGDTADFAAYVDLATSANVPTNGVISWFQYSGNTYIVEDVSTALTYSAGNDIVVRLTGLIDLSTASLNNGTNTTLLLG